MDEYIRVLVVRSESTVLWDSMLFSHLLTTFLLCGECRQQYLVGSFLFLSAMREAKSWLESNVLYIAVGCAPFVLGRGQRCSLAVANYLFY